MLKWTQKHKGGLSLAQIDSSALPVRLARAAQRLLRGRISCRVCAGSPYAYFDLYKGYLVCQNCGNAFTPDSVGGAGMGCYPWSIEDYTVAGDQILISSEAVSSMTKAFTNWKKGL